MEKKMRPYQKFFSENKLWQKLSGYARVVGVKVTYTVLLLFYAYKRKETPAWAKTIILGALGYFVSPIDAIPDLSPIIGYTDDFGVLSFGLVTIAAYVNDEVKAKAKAQLGKWFKQYDETEVQAVDQQF